MQVLIRPCDASDIDVLEAVLPAGEPGLHRERFEEHLRGECSYLVAWAGARPVGHIKIRWSGSVHRYVKHTFPHFPEVRRLAVDAPFRSRGVGASLLAAAEAVAADRGYDGVGLAVAVDNDVARRLYDAKGYVDWGRGTFTSRWTRRVGGVQRTHEHVVTYMVKTLASRRRAVA